MSVYARDLLGFDPSDLPESDSVGAYVRAGSDGDLIASQTIAAEEWLNVASALFDGSGNAISSTGGALDINLASTDVGLEADLDGVYNVGTNADPDNVGLIAHDRAASPGDAEQLFRSTGGSADADGITAANVHGLDVNSFLMAYNGTTWDRVTKDGTSGGVNMHLAGSDVDFGGTPDTGFTNAAETVNTTSSALVTSVLSDRKALWIQNHTGGRMYIGASGVSTSDGFRMRKDGVMKLEIGASLAVHAVAASGTNDVRILQTA